MTTPAETQAVKDTLGALFEALDTHAEATILERWHPEATLFVNGRELAVHPVAWLVGLPRQVHFQLEGVSHVDVHGLIATARADYRLSVGVHAGYFNLVKVRGQWLIANWVDHGVEAA